MPFRAYHSMDSYKDELFDERYRLIELLGMGTSAKVYRAVDVETESEVAVKIFDEARLLDEEAKRQFDHEVKAFALLDSHPNIVAYYGGSMRDDCRYIVMELAVGETLMHYMNHKGGRLSVEEALSYFSQILSALSHAHSKGIVHRDIKPQNVRLIQGGLVKLVDFGIALIPGFENTPSGKTVGTVNYISPEQASGGCVDARSDIYSAGILLYEMLCGQLPFSSDKSNAYDRMDDIIRKHLKETPASPSYFNPNIPTAIEQIVLRAMNKNPAKRFDSADEMMRYIKLYYENPHIRFSFDLPNDPYDAYEALPDDTLATKFVPSALKLVGQVKEGSVQEPSTGIPVRKKRTTLFLAGVFLVLFSLFVLVSLVSVNRIFSYDAGQKTVITIGGLLDQVYSEDLLKQLQKKGYDVQVEYEYHASIPLNTIMSQEPPAQSVQHLTENEKPKLRLTLSGGCRVMIMPDYRGKENRSVELDLKNQGFTVQIVKQHSASVEQGLILSTTPSAGEAAIQNEPIILYVSAGEEAVYQYVPMLIGLSREEATALLEASGILNYRVTYQESSEPEGFVISQSHLFGEKIVANLITVEIVISGQLISS